MSGPSNSQQKNGDERALDLGFAKDDLERAKRQGIGEVVFCQNKTADHVVQIFGKLFDHEGFALGTRCSQEQASAVQSALPEARYHCEARVLQIGHCRHFPKLPGKAAIISAGTADIPVAEEAAVVCEALGQKTLRIYDVGVAGLHRLLAQLETIRECRVVIVVAGMEGALCSVVAGLVNRPVIAVPTSVGYGASFGGVAALLGMLNSCGSGVTVVNIDNGFGAAFAAVQMNRLSLVPDSVPSAN